MYSLHAFFKETLKTFFSFTISSEPKQLKFCQTINNRKKVQKMPIWKASNAGKKLLNNSHNGHVNTTQIITNMRLSFKIPLDFKTNVLLI